MCSLQFCLFLPVLLPATGRPGACYSLTPAHSAQWALVSAGNVFIEAQSDNLLKDHNNVCARSRCLSSSGAIMKTSRRLDSNATIIIPFSCNSVL